MSHYFDASALVPMLVREAVSAEVLALVESLSERPVVSDFAAGEVVSTIARLARMGALTQQDAQNRLNTFDAWRTGDTQGIDVLNSDIAQAAAFVRQFDLRLRMPDALHLALAQRAGVSLVTVDARMVKAGGALGVLTISP